MIRDSVVLMFHLFNAFGLGSQSPGRVATSFYIVCLVFGFLSDFVVTFVRGSNHRALVLFEWVVGSYSDPSSKAKSNKQSISLSQQKEGCHSV